LLRSGSLILTFAFWLRGEGRIVRRKTLGFRPYWPLLGLFNRR
jgi:hypothetical protein